MIQTIEAKKKRHIPQLTQEKELSLLLKGLQKQVADIQPAVKEQTAILRTQKQQSNAQQHTLDRIHDRLDAIAVESRVTNLLLSDLVALHQTVITEDTDDLRHAIREDAYNRVRNAE